MPEEIDALVTEYNSILSHLTDNYAPLKTKIIKTRTSAPWYSAEIDTAKRQRRKAERMWRRSKSLTDFKLFKTKKNYVTHLINKARREYYTDFINENGNNKSRLFSAVKTVLNTNNEICFPNLPDNTALSNDIGSFFVSKIVRIRAEVDATVLEPQSNNLVPNDYKFVSQGGGALTCFRELSQEEVKILAMKSSKKYCSLDPMPTPLVMDCLDTLLPVVTHIINSSLVNGYFPENWKEALWKPLLKRPGLDAVFNNLRPICNLQFISKLTERAVYEQTYDHLVLNGLFPELQSAYRKGYSTETALLKVHNDILLSMDRQQVTLLVLLDLSAAFDTVDHANLLRRLETSFGIEGKAHEWFMSYLSNRSQRVAFGDGLSDKFHLPCGVPQGSCLGPLLFTMYASKLFQVIKEYLPSAHAYADDSQLYLSFKPDSKESEIGCVSAMETCIRAIRAWMIEDKMKLNNGKTEFLIIGSRQQLEKVHIDMLSVGNIHISPVSEAKSLGTIVDSNMSLTPHINHIVRAAFYQLHNIRRIRKYLTLDATKVLVHAFVTSRMDYCNSLLYGLAAKSLSKLQRAQNAAARLITNTSKFSHITPVLYSLHWLPVEQRVHYKVLILTFKAMYGLAPTYICKLVEVMKPSSYSLRRNKDILLTISYTKTKKTFGDRAFAVAAPKIFDDLPREIRHETNFNKFKTLLKTFLFRIAYA